MSRKRYEEYTIENCYLMDGGHTFEFDGDKMEVIITPTEDMLERSNRLFKQYIKELKERNVCSNKKEKN